MTERQTREPQYKTCLDLEAERGLEKMGLMASLGWYDDPKRLTFTLSRYKFVAKMLSGKANVLEVGCADAFGTRIVRQETGQVTATDFDPIFIEDAQSRNTDKWPVEFAVHDMVEAPYPTTFDAAFALDVLEHISPDAEPRFLANMVKSLTINGVLILGIPSLESQEYASEISKAGHVNCKSMPDFKQTMERYFHNVFMFSMNDEVVHTGYHKMAQYLFALCTDRK